MKACLKAKTTLLNGMFALLDQWYVQSAEGSLQPTSCCLRVLNTAAAAEGWSEEDQLRHRGEKLVLVEREAADCSETPHSIGKFSECC